jgi:hypothetical protein
MASKKVVKKVVKKAAPKKAGPRPPVDESRKPRNQRKPMMEPETKKPLRDTYRRNFAVEMTGPNDLAYFSQKVWRGNRATKQERLKYPPIGSAQRAAKVKRKER